MDLYEEPVIESIELIFENVECINIKSEYILDMILSDVNTYIVHKKMSNGSINYVESEIAKGVTLRLSKDADQDYSPFGLDDNLSQSYMTTVFSRILKYPDITHIEIRYRNGVTRTIEVSWPQDSDDSNAYQTSEITGDGSLLIEIISHDEVWHYSNSSKDYSKYEV